MKGRGGVERQRGQRGLRDVRLRHSVVVMRQLGVVAGRPRAVSPVRMRRHGQTRICRCLRTVQVVVVRPALTAFSSTARKQIVLGQFTNQSGRERRFATVDLRENKEKRKVDRNRRTIGSLFLFSSDERFAACCT